MTAAIFHWGNMPIYNEDCIRGMQRLLQENVKVDCIITDPPYLMNFRSGKRPKEHRFSQPILNDKDQTSLIKTSIFYMSQLLKEGGACYVFCSEHHIDLFKQEIEKYLSIKNILIWVKNGGALGDLSGQYARVNEFIIFATKGQHILNGKRDRNVLFFNKVPHTQQQHQNQKPLKLIKYLMLKSSSRGDTVLDAFMGSGTTGVACKELHRNFIGYELDKTYFNIARKRIDEA